LARGISVTQVVEEAVPKVKTSEVVVGFIRLPFSSDEAIINKFEASIETELAEYGADLRSPRIRRVSLFTEELIFDVYEPPPQSPSPLAPIVWALIIAGLLVLGWVLVILLYIRVVELEKVLEEVGKDIETVIEEKKTALAEGKITEEYAKELDDALEAAKKRADEGGRTDWWNMLEKVMEYLPLVIIGLGAIAVIGMLPRRRGD